MIMDDDRNIEEDPEGRPMRSVDCHKKSFVRFANCSTCDVDIIWISYEGEPVLYKTLQPCHVVDINTYTTHPWIFRDHVTAERFVINNRPVFWAQAPRTCTVATERGTREAVVRTVQYITAPLRDLKSNCIMNLIQMLPDAKSIDTLELPLSLRDELSDAMKKYHPTKTTPLQIQNI